MRMAKNNKVDFDICIAHRGGVGLLWATVEGVGIELENSGFDYRFYICSNGDGPLALELPPLLEGLKKTKKLGWFHHSERGMTPQAARQLASKQGDAPLICFLDNHCLVHPRFFKYAQETFEKYDCDLVHSATSYIQGWGASYHYLNNLRKNFWGKSSMPPEDLNTPYRIAAGGHGGFLVRRDAWQKTGGYKWFRDFKGWCGEESLDLIWGMLDKTIYIDPRVTQSHYAGMRGYGRGGVNNYYCNQLAAANLIGGQQWLDTVFKSFCEELETSRQDKVALFQEALRTSEPMAQEFRKVQKRTLDEQLRLFDQLGIPYNDVKESAL
jgi:hypothetical protein